jgi:ribA/ribD-fused uncharacterized protein
MKAFAGRLAFLSNFTAAAVELDGEWYPSVEHAYQAAKTEDVAARQRFRAFGVTPGQAKRMGRRVEIRESWEAVRIAVMRDLLRQKFAHPKLRAKLLATGNEKLVETNDWNDTFWGVCDGIGENRLGKMLMEIRAEIRYETGEIPRENP